MHGSSIRIAMVISCAIATYFSAIDVSADTQKQPNVSQIGEASNRCKFRALQDGETKRRDDREVECVIDQHKGEFYAIYRRALQRNPHLSGTVEVKFEVDSQGAVQNARLLRSTTNDPMFEEQVVRKLGTLQWRAMNGARWSGSHPFTFASG